MKDAYDFARLAMDTKFKTFAIYEHCLPFSVVRAYERREASKAGDLDRRTRPRNVGRAAGREIRRLSH